MKAPLTRIALVMSLALTSSGMAATRAVFPGQSIQAAVDACNAGDTVIVFEGTYVEDITINKLVQLAKPKDANVVLGGSVTLSGLTSPYVLHDFNVGSNSTKRISVVNCSHVTLQDLDANKAQGIVATNTNRLTLLRFKNREGTASSVTDVGRFEVAKDSVLGGTLTLTKSNSILRQSDYGNVRSDQGDFFLLGGTVSGTVSVSGQTKAGLAGTGITNAVFFQGKVGDRLTSNAAYSWVGYNDLKFVSLTGGSYAVLVGNMIDGKGQSSKDGPCGIRVSETAGSVQVKILNNVIRNMGAAGQAAPYQGSGWQWGGAGVRLQAGGQVDIFNNVFHDIAGQTGAINTGNEGGVGVFVENPRLYKARVSVRCNIFWNMARGGNSPDFLCAIRAPLDNVEFVDNAVHMINGVLARGGIEAGLAPGVNPIFGPASPFSSALPSDEKDYYNKDTSGFNNRGSNGDVRFNNLDNKPNSWGRWGGSQFDPEGKTTRKPVVIGFDITPDQVLEGATTQIKLMNIGAVMIEP